MDYMEVRAEWKLATKFMGILCSVRVLDAALWYNHRATGKGNEDGALSRIKTRT